MPSAGLVPLGREGEGDRARGASAVLGFELRGDEKVQVQLTNLSEEGDAEEILQAKTMLNLSFTQQVG